MLIYGVSAGALEFIATEGGTCAAVSPAAGARERNDTPTAHYARLSYTAHPSCIPIPTKPASSEATPSFGELASSTAPPDRVLPSGWIVDLGPHAHLLALSTVLVQVPSAADLAAEPGACFPAHCVWRVCAAAPGVQSERDWVVLAERAVLQACDDARWMRLSLGGTGSTGGGAREPGNWRFVRLQALAPSVADEGGLAPEPGDRLWMLVACELFGRLCFEVEARVRDCLSRANARLAALTDGALHVRIEWESLRASPPAAELFAWRDSAVVLQSIVWLIESMAAAGLLGEMLHPALEPAQQPPFGKAGTGARSGARSIPGDSDADSAVSGGSVVLRCTVAGSDDDGDGGDGGHDARCDVGAAGAGAATSDSDDDDDDTDVAGTGRTRGLRCISLACAWPPISDAPTAPYSVRLRSRGALMRLTGPFCCLAHVLTRADLASSVLARLGCLSAWRLRAWHAASLLRLSEHVAPVNLARGRPVRARGAYGDPRALLSESCASSAGGNIEFAASGAGGEGGAWIEVALDGACVVCSVALTAARTPAVGEAGASLARSDERFAENELRVAVSLYERDALVARAVVGGGDASAAGAQPLGRLEVRFAPGVRADCVRVELQSARGVALAALGVYGPDALPHAAVAAQAATSAAGDGGSERGAGAGAGEDEDEDEDEDKGGDASARPQLLVFEASFAGDDDSLARLCGADGWLLCSRLVRAVRLLGGQGDWSAAALRRLVARTVFWNVQPSRAPSQLRWMNGRQSTLVLWLGADWQSLQGGVARSSRVGGGVAAAGLWSAAEFACLLRLALAATACKSLDAATSARALAALEMLCAACIDSPVLAIGVTAWPLGAALHSLAFSPKSALQQGLVARLLAWARAPARRAVLCDCDVRRREARSTALWAAEESGLGRVAQAGGMGLAVGGAGGLAGDDGSASAGVGGDVEAGEMFICAWPVVLVNGFSGSRSESLAVLTTAALYVVGTAAGASSGGGELIAQTEAVVRAPLAHLEGIRLGPTPVGGGAGGGGGGGVFGCNVRLCVASAIGVGVPKAMAAARRARARLPGAPGYGASVLALVAALCVRLRAEEFSRPAALVFCLPRRLTAFSLFCALLAAQAPRARLGPQAACAAERPDAGVAIAGLAATAVPRGGEMRGWDFIGACLSRLGVVPLGAAATAAATAATAAATAATAAATTATAAATTATAAATTATAADVALAPAAAAVAAACRTSLCGAVEACVAALRDSESRLPCVPTRLTLPSLLEAMFMSLASATSAATSLAGRATNDQPSAVAAAADALASATAGAATAAPALAAQDPLPPGLASSSSGASAAAAVRLPFPALRLSAPDALHIIRAALGRLPRDVIAAVDYLADGSLDAALAQAAAGAGELPDLQLGAESVAVPVQDALAACLHVLVTAGGCEWHFEGSLGALPWGRAGARLAAEAWPPRRGEVTCDVHLDSVDETHGALCELAAATTIAALASRSERGLTAGGPKAPERVSCLERPPVTLAKQRRARDA